MKTLYEYSGANLLYWGEARAGTPPSAPGWRIRRYTYDGANLVRIQWARGTAALTNAWDDRATYGYS